MNEPQQYELLDFGNGRKLERFGDVVVDRPSPVASGACLSPERWESAAARLQRDGKRFDWQVDLDPAEPWEVELAGVRFQLQTTPTGQVGIFPEQEVNWRWMQRLLSKRPGARVLNLFAYTGGSTLAAARAGAEVVHVDAAKSVVSWARRNAAASQLEDAPIRWIVEDAVRFVQREIKRGRKYDAIILDPPSYGHGPKGESWQVSRDLLGLLQSCRELLSERPVLFLLSCHSPGFGPAELSAALSTCLFGSCGAGVRTRSLSLKTASGRKLPAGDAAYWP